MKFPSSFAVTAIGVAETAIAICVSGLKQSLRIAQTSLLTKTSDSLKFYAEEMEDLIKHFIFSRKLRKLSFYFVEEI